MASYEDDIRRIASTNRFKASQAEKQQDKDAIEGATFSLQLGGGTTFTPPPYEGGQEGDTCSIDSDCAEGLICFEGKCVKEDDVPKPPPDTDDYSPADGETAPVALDGGSPILGGSPSEGVYAPENWTVGDYIDYTGSIEEAENNIAFPIETISGYDCNSGALITLDVQGQTPSENFSGCTALPQKSPSRNDHWVYCQGNQQGYATRASMGYPMFGGSEANAASWLASEMNAFDWYGATQAWIDSPYDSLRTYNMLSCEKTNQYVTSQSFMYKTGTSYRGYVTVQYTAWYNPSWGSDYITTGTRTYFINSYVKTPLSGWDVWQNGYGLFPYSWSHPHLFEDLLEMGYYLVPTGYTGTGGQPLFLVYPPNYYYDDAWGNTDNAHLILKDGQWLACEADSFYDDVANLSGNQVITLCDGQGRKMEYKARDNGGFITRQTDVSGIPYGLVTVFDANGKAIAFGDSTSRFWEEY